MLLMVRKKRLELSRVTPLASKASASTNSATFARVRRLKTGHFTKAGANNNHYLKIID